MPNDATKEAVARIVDPAAWTYWDTRKHYAALPDTPADRAAECLRRADAKVAPSLSRVDQIIALLADRAR